MHAGARDEGGGNWQVTLVVQNTGWLPSYVSKRALERKIVRELIAEIELARGRDAGAGQARGSRRASSRAAPTSTPASRSGAIPTSPTTAPRSSGWCAAAPGERIDLVARHERAGTVRASVTLTAAELTSDARLAT